MAKKERTLESQQNSEVELKPLPPNECDMCGTLIDHRLTKCGDCGFN